MSIGHGRAIGWRGIRWALLVSVITAAGLLLRLWRLGGQSLWFDEAQTAFVARFSFAEILQRAYRPPLYHWILHVWGLLGPASEFWLRLPSALWGAAVPPMVYLAAARLYGRKTALLAGALAALSPTMIWYAQEVRMYSLMTLQFAILLYLFTLLLHGEGVLRAGFWLALFATTVASLYTHYFASPFLAILATVSAFALLVGRRWRTLGIWMGVQAAAALAFVPWLLVIRGGRGGTADFVAAEVLPVVAEVPRASEFVSRSWLFYTAGASVGERLLVYGLDLAALAALAVAVLFLLPRAVSAAWAALPGKGDSPQAEAGLPQPDLVAGHSLHDVYLLALVGGPLLMAVLMYKLRPGIVHPRHLMMIAIPLTIMVARAASLAFIPAMDRREPLICALLRRLAGAATLLSFTGIYLLGLGLLWRDPGLQRPDVRSLARTVASSTAVGDIVLFPYRDYAFDHYFQGPATVYHLETRVGDEDLANWLLPRIHGAGRAVYLRWVHVFSDPRSFVPWLLQSNGRLVSHFWQAERWVSVYDLSSPLVVPPLSPANVRIDPLRLTGVHFPLVSPADQPVPVALQLEATAPPALDYRASVRVIDPGGHVIAAADSTLLGERSPVGTASWAPGALARNYFFVQLPPGTPPLSYTLAVTVYHGQTALDVLSPAGAAMGTVHTLGAFRVSTAQGFPEHLPASLPMTPLNREVAPGLLLEGFALDREAIRAGEALAVTLYWRATAAPLPDYEPGLRLTLASGRVVGEQAGHPAHGLYPSSGWQAGELVIDRRQVLVAPDAEAGAAQLLLAIGAGEPLLLHQLAVQQSDRRFTLPQAQYPLDVTLGGVARLRGFSLESKEVKWGEPLALTLYWEAINEKRLETSYSVFAQLLDPQERVIAQHDGMPAEGNWPTTAWIKGQVIIDPRHLTFSERAGRHQGEALLYVGLYDSKSLQRLATPGGEDRIILPVRVTVQ